jgi:hypothetical protein
VLSFNPFVEDQSATLLDRQRAKSTAMSRDWHALDQEKQNAYAPSATRSTCDQESFDVVRDLFRRDVLERAREEALCNLN